MVEETVRRQLAFQEFLKEVEKHPSWLYSTPDAIIEAFAYYSSKYGNLERRDNKLVEVKGRKIDLESILTVKDNDPRRLGRPLFGLEDSLYEFITQVAELTDPNNRKIVLLVGPPGSGKNELINIASATYSYWRKNTIDGILYTPVIDLNRLESEGVKSLFNGEGEYNKFVSEIRGGVLGTMWNIVGKIREPYIKITLAENTLNSLLLWFNGTPYEEEIRELAERLNVTPKRDAESTTARFIKDILAEAFENAGGDASDPNAFGKLLSSIIVLRDLSEPSLVERVVATTDKNLDYQGIFGNKIDLGPFSKIQSENPFTLSFGVAGSQTSPGVRRSLLLFSEFLKSDPAFKNSFLDFIQGQRISTNAGSETFDALVVGTANLIEAKEMGQDVYLSRRVGLVGVPYMLNYRDVIKFLNYEFAKIKNRLNVEFSDRFIEAVAITYVGLTLEPPPQEFRNQVDMLTKIKIYAGEVPDSKITVNDLRGDDVRRSPLDRVEGNRGMPNSVIPQLAKEISSYLREMKIEKYNVLDEILAESILSSQNILYNFLVSRTWIKVPEDRLTGEYSAPVVAIAYYKDAVTTDVLKALVSQPVLEEQLGSYVVQIWYAQSGSKSYIDREGRSRAIDFNWLKKVEETAKVDSASFRDLVYKQLNALMGQSGEDIYRVLPKFLNYLTRTQSGRNIEKALLELSRTRGARLSESDVRNVSEKLLKMGYTPNTATLAIEIYELNS